MINLSEGDEMKGTFVLNVLGNPYCQLYLSLVMPGTLRVATAFLRSGSPRSRIRRCACPQPFHFGG
jgi:hypothetical protein